MKGKADIKARKTRSSRALRLRQRGCDESESEDDDDDVIKCTGSSGVQAGNSQWNYNLLLFFTKHLTFPMLIEKVVLFIDKHCLIFRRCVRRGELYEDGGG